MSAWWGEDHARLAAEKMSISGLQNEETWLDNVEWSFDDYLRLRSVFDIKIKDTVHQFVMTYHNTFPSSPPSIAPINNNIISSHQYRNGELCLEIRPDNWRPEFDGADMIRSAYKLLSIENTDELENATIAPSAHQVTHSMATRFAVGRFYVTKEVKDVLLDNAPDITRATFAQQYIGSKNLVIHLVELETEDWAWKSKLPPSTFKEEAYTVNGKMIRLSIETEEFCKKINENNLTDIMLLQEEKNDDNWLRLIITSDNEILLIKKFPGSENPSLYTTIYSSSKEVDRTGIQIEDLSEKKIAIVGLGSIGSKIATILARSGVSKFELIDDDILHHENLVRHDADWRDVGMHKADVVARRLRLISSNIEVNVRKTAIGAQVSATEAGNVDVAISNCYLVIDATANPHVFNHLAGIISKSRSTLVWGGVHAGGIGGYIARSRTKQDPGPYVIRDGLNEFYSTVDAKPPVADSRDYQGEESDKVLIASDAQVSVIASHMANLAIDSIVNVTNSEFGDHAYIIGLTSRWDFGVFDTRPIHVSEEICEKVVDEHSSEDAKDFVNDLIKKKLDELKN